MAKSKAYRADDYVNMLNKYGTAQDNSTAYEFRHDGIVPDMTLTENYETNGLFAKIIDAPADEAIKHGYSLGLKNADIEKYIGDTLDRLEWEDRAATAIKWSRLYGGALGVMLINDGGGIDEPVDMRRVKGIEEIRIYERAVVYPDYSSLYNYDHRDPTRSSTPKFGMPEYYQVNSIYGQFWVHESRCLIFRNGIVPERTMQPFYRFWGLPEYLRIRRELRETVTSHSTGVKMLERSIQSIYSMKDLASLLATDEGMDIVVRRLQAIDMARGILNSIAIDSDGETWDFKTIPMAGVKDVIDTTCNMLSAVTNIPQTVLFGRSPAGQNSTGLSDLENWYNYIEKIQKLMLRNNLRDLINIIVAVGLREGKLEEQPNIKLTFNPLWSMSASEQAAVDQQKAATAQAKATTAQMYLDMGVLTPHEIRRGLAQDGEYQVEELIDEDDLESGDDLWGSEDIPTDPTAPGTEPSDMISERRAADGAKPPGGVGVIVLHDGKVLVGRRTDNGLLCGPGGHIEPGETPRQAAIRETREAFGITPKGLNALGQLDAHDRPFVFLCTEYDGTLDCTSGEIQKCGWAGVEWLKNNAADLFPTFAASLALLPDDMKSDDADDADDDVVIRTAENGKKYAINEETGEIAGGLGPNSKGAEVEQGGESGGTENAATSKAAAAMGTEYMGVKGQAAVDKLLQEKQGHVKGAFTRDDIGDVDLVWGDDNMGLQHIIKRRGETGQDVSAVLNSLTDTVENGKLTKGKKGRLQIEKDGNRAIIEPKLYGEDVSFVFTAYEVYK